MTMNRAENFADGVFSIAITLLVFELVVPPPGESLTAALPGLVPSLLIYVLSFVIIGIYWMNHHRQFACIRRYDQTLQWLNLLFLMFVALVPFSARALGWHSDEQAGVIIYGVNLILLSASHYLIWWYASHERRLVGARRELRGLSLTARLALKRIGIYLLAIGLSFVHPAISILLFVLAQIPAALGWFYRPLEHEHTREMLQASVPPSPQAETAPARRTADEDVYINQLVELRLRELLTTRLDDLLRTERDVREEEAETLGVH